MRKGEREGTPLNKNATLVSLRENNTFIITAHCGVWFHRERERERESYFEREQHLHHHCTLWGLVPEREREGYFEREQHLHHHGTLWGLVPQRERERVSLRENNTFIITAHCGVWFYRERGLL
jgi:hypothetical protein